MPANFLVTTGKRSGTLRRYLVAVRSPAMAVLNRPEAPPVPADRLDAEAAPVRSYLTEVGDA